MLISLLTGNPPPKSITWEHIHFRSFSFPATASFLLLLYSLFFFPQELFPALPWFFLNDFYYIIAVSRLDVSGPKQTRAAKPEHRTCQQRQAGGCWLPSPAHSSRQSCGRIPAASPSQAAAAKIGKKIQLELSWCAIHRWMNILLLFQERLLKEHTRQQLWGAVLVHRLKI